MLYTRCTLVVHSLYTRCALVVQRPLPTDATTETRTTVLPSPLTKLTPPPSPSSPSFPILPHRYYDTSIFTSGNRYPSALPPPLLPQPQPNGLSPLQLMVYENFKFMPRQQILQQPGGGGVGGGIVSAIFSDRLLNCNCESQICVIVSKISNCWHTPIILKVRVTKKGKKN